MAALSIHTLAVRLLLVASVARSDQSAWLADWSNATNGTPPAEWTSESWSDYVANQGAACARIAVEWAGATCTSCLRDDEIIKDVDDQESSACLSRSSADDVLVEERALFAAGRSDATTKLWRTTSRLFSDDARIEEVELSLPVSAWKRIVDNPAAEQYETGNITLISTGKHVSGVGIRPKGYYGSLRLCLLNMTTCQKLSYKIKITHSDKKARLLGLKRLQLHASSSDPTLMREKLSYSLWREMGVPAVRQIYADLYLRLIPDGAGGDVDVVATTSNSTTPTRYPLGVHLLTEVMDGRFTKTYDGAGGGDGTLLKEVFPGLNKTEIAERLETNENKKTVRKNSVAQVLAWADALNAATDDYELAKVMFQFADVPNWAAYTAVDRAVQHWDGPWNFRCKHVGSDGESPKSPKDMCDGADTVNAMTHNFMIYERDDDDKTTRFQIWPWDVDSTWKSAKQLENQIGALPEWDEASSPAACRRTFTTTYNMTEQYAPSCSRVVRSLGRGLRAEYVKAVRQLLNGPLQLCRIQAKIDRWYGRIGQLIQRDRELGLYPGRLSKEADDDENSNGRQLDEGGMMGQDPQKSFEAHVLALRDEIVPSLIERLRDSVSCSRALGSAADWGTGLPWSNKEDRIVAMWHASDRNMRTGESFGGVGGYLKELIDLNK